MQDHRNLLIYQRELSLPPAKGNKTVLRSLPPQEDALAEADLHRRPGVGPHHRPGVGPHHRPGADLHRLIPQ